MVKIHIQEKETNASVCCDGVIEECVYKVIEECVYTRSCYRGVRIPLKLVS